MSTGVAYQVSPKLPDGTLINIQGDTEEEFKGRLAFFTENAQDVVGVSIALRAAWTVENPTAAAAPPAPPAGGTSAPSAAGDPAAPFCPHGQMVFRSSKPGGKQWTGYFCPSPQGTPDQCKPRFNN